MTRWSTSKTCRSEVEISGDFLWVRVCKPRQIKFVATPWLQRKAEVFDRPFFYVFLLWAGRLFLLDENQNFSQLSLNVWRAAKRWGNKSFTGYGRGDHDIGTVDIFLKKDHCCNYNFFSFLFCSDIRIKMIKFKQWPKRTFKKILLRAMDLQ